MLKMFRLIENWPQFRATIVNINTDLYSIVRSIKSTTNDNNNNNSNNNEVKHEDSVREAHAERPARLDRLLRTDAVTIDVQIMNSWSTVDKSPYINILEEGLVGKRRPVAKSTDCMRGRIGYTNGLHVWSINWPQDCRGTHAMVGVATDSAPLHATGYCSLVGSNADSWGWDLVRNKCYHNSKELLYPNWITSKEVFQIPDDFMVVLDMDDGTLGFIVDNVYLGIAFDGLKGKKLYPIISTVWGNGEIAIKYYSGLEPGPLLLQESSRKVIRASVGKDRIKRIKTELLLPNKLKDYLMN